MTGRVRCFLPSERQGILQTETGTDLLFSVNEDFQDLHGGDIVEFQQGQDGKPVVKNVTLRHRWAEMLNQEHRSLVNQLHETVKIIS
ncbi:MAG: hypothetical protein JSV03_12495 [Planctomycetota bacterium]|nr:MAG: hypothetical protein JSV03_12495 [Planctomycetota bacterium]